MEVIKRIKLFVFPIIAIFLCIFSEIFVENLNYTIFALMVIYGLESIAKHFILKQSFNHLTNIFWGIMEVVLGILVLITGKEKITNICIIWAVWSLLRESNEVKHVISEINEFKKINILNVIDLLESTIAIIFSILLVLNPTEHHALTHIYLLAIELTLNASLPFFEKWSNKDKKEVSAVE